MARALLITRKDIVEMTVINGVVDSDKYLQNIRYTQDAELEPIIGEALLDKIEAEIIAKTISGVYLDLVNNYIKSFLVYAAASDYILAAHVTVDNGGVNRYAPDNGSPANTDDVLALTAKVDKKAQFYGQRLIKYLKDNQTDFPEYTASTTSSVFFGWQIDDNNGCS